MNIAYITSITNIANNGHIDNIANINDNDHIANITNIADITINAHIAKIANFAYIANIAYILLIHKKCPLFLEKCTLLSCMPYGYACLFICVFAIW